jgi:hypothetical protein
MSTTLPHAADTARQIATSTFCWQIAANLFSHDEHPDKAIDRLEQLSYWLEEYGTGATVFHANYAVVEMRKTLNHAPDKFIMNYWKMGAFSSDPAGMALYYEKAIDICRLENNNDLSSIISSYIEQLKRCGQKVAAKQWKAVLGKAAKLSGHSGPEDSIDVEYVKQAMESAGKQVAS